MNNSRHHIDFGYKYYPNEISKFDEAMLKDLGEMNWKKYSELKNKMNAEDENSLLRGYFNEEEFFTDKEFKLYLPPSAKTIGEKSTHYFITFQ